MLLAMLNWHGILKKRTSKITNVKLSQDTGYFLSHRRVHDLKRGETNRLQSFLSPRMSICIARVQFSVDFDEMTEKFLDGS